MGVIHKGTKIASTAVTGDTLPIGSIVEIEDGTPIPFGWEEVDLDKLAIGQIYDDLLGGALQVYGNIKSNGQFESSGNGNRGAWNGPTVGTVTQVVDDTRAQHSVIVGQRADNNARLYGVDMLDDYANPVMRLYAGNNYLEVSGTPSVNGSAIIKASDVVNTLDSTSTTVPLSANMGSLIESLMLVNGYNGRSKNISGADVNTKRENGFYYGNNVTNAPTQYGYLFVISHLSSAEYCYQVWFHQGAIQIYAREIINGTPSAWKQFTLT